MKWMLLTTAFLCGTGLANDAAMNDGAQGPEPMGWRSGKESVIQMKEEHLEIHFGHEMTKAKVSFTFLSHKTSGTATQKLGFPNSSRSTLDGDISGPIQNLVTKVNGEVVTAELVEGFYREIVGEDGSVTYEREKTKSPGENIRKLAWYVIEVDFPVGEEVIVEREYDCPTGGDTMMNSFFVYETRTGAAWKGNIEKLTAEVTFDKNVDKNYVAFTPEDGWQWNNDQSQATLTWTNFEPRTDEDRRFFEVSALDLDRVKKIIRENPDIGTTVDEWVATWKKNNER